jgi:ribosomal protein L21E
MKSVPTIVALLALALAIPSFAADPAPTTAPAATAERHKVLHGMVKKIDEKSITVAFGKGDNAKEVVVETDDKTEYTLDHQPAKFEDVKVGELVAVAPAEGVAHHIDVNTTHKEPHALLHGIVSKVDGSSITVTIGKGDKAKEVVVETDDKTTFTVDHEPAKLADLKVGELVAVAPAKGVAQHIDLNTTHKDAPTAAK